MAAMRPRPSWALTDLEGVGSGSRARARSVYREGGEREGGRVNFRTVKDDTYASQVNKVLQNTNKRAPGRTR